MEAFLPAIPPSSYITDVLRPAIPFNTASSGTVACCWIITSDVLPSSSVPEFYLAFCESSQTPNRGELKENVHEYSSTPKDGNTPTEQTATERLPCFDTKCVQGHQIVPPHPKETLTGVPTP